MRSDVFLLVLAGFFSSVAVAVDLQDGLLRCSQEENDAARLDCYDREIARIRQSAPAQRVDESMWNPAIAKPEATTATESKTVSLATESGLQESNIADFGKDEKMLRSEREQESGSIDEMYATVVAIEKSASGKRVFSLDNGQVWLEKFETRALKVEPGDPVRIKSGAFGSYRLFGSAKLSAKVERIR